MGADGLEPPQALPADLQSALVDHLSTPPDLWSWREESNLQPGDYKSPALPLSHASKGRGELYMLASYFVKGFYAKKELFNLTEI